MRSLSLALLATAILASPAGGQSPQASFAAAVAATEAALTPYRFDAEATTSRGAYALRFDPTKPEGARVSVLSAEGENAAEVAGRARDRLKESNGQGIWCANDRFFTLNNLRLVREDAQSATYAFTPVPGPLATSEQRAAFPQLNGEMTILKDSVDVSFVRLVAPAAFKPNPLAKVERFEMTMRCEEAPNGRRFAAETRTRVTGSAFGQSFDETTTQRISSLAPAR